MKKKLKLSDLKVESFVTDLNADQTNNVVGGAATVADVNCARSAKADTTCISNQFYSVCKTCGIACTYDCEVA